MQLAEQIENSERAGTTPVSLRVTFRTMLRSCWSFPLFRYRKEQCKQ